MSTLPVLDASQLGVFRTKPIGTDSFFVWPWLKFFQTLERARETAPQYFFTGHATRVQINPGNVSPGTLFYESDRTVAYISNGSNWIYLTGIFNTVLGGLPTDLGANDAGFLANVTDYNHLLQWSGAMWGWGPGEDGSGYTIPFVNPPSPLAGWHAADGSTVNQMTSSGGLAPATIPNTPGSFFRQ